MAAPEMDLSDLAEDISNNIIERLLGKPLLVDSDILNRALEVLADLF